MRRLIQVLISLAAVAVILFGARYAIAQERLHDVNLRQLYLQMNDQYFTGELDTTVPVSWGDPGVGNDAVTRYGKNADSTSEIVIDRGAAASEERLLYLMGHEQCHLKTRAERWAGQDVHGEAWQACMERFR